MTVMHFVRSTFECGASPRRFQHAPLHALRKSATVLAAYSRPDPKVGPGVRLSMEEFRGLHGIETYPGTGVGLAIVRKGMERLGGQVGLKSSPWHGSLFWIDLPKKDTAK